MATHDPMALPADLPVPSDDGAARHLPGRRMPDIALPSTDGSEVALDQVVDPSARVVVYAYPRTGRPGEPSLTDDWDQIPGARGCTPQSCAFRDHHAELAAAGADVYGLSTQDTAYQQEAVERLRLPFSILSDADLRLTRALDLPTFTVAGQSLLKRLTLIIRNGQIEHVFYPVFPPDTHAVDVLRWLHAHTWTCAEVVTRSPLSSRRSVPSPTIDELTIADPPEAWRSAGFDVEGDAFDIGSVRFRLAGADAGRGIVACTMRDVAAERPDGLPVSRSTGRPAPAVREPTSERRPRARPPRRLQLGPGTNGVGAPGGRP